MTALQYDHRPSFSALSGKLLSYHLVTRGTLKLYRSREQSTAMARSGGYGARSENDINFRSLIYIFPDCEYALPTAQRWNLYLFRSLIVVKALTTSIEANGVLTAPSVNRCFPNVIARERSPLFWRRLTGQRLDMWGG